MWLHWKGRGAAARDNEYQLLGSLWQEEGEVDGDEPNVEEPLQQREAVEVSQGPLVPAPKQLRYHQPGSLTAVPKCRPVDL